MKMYIEVPKKTWKENPKFFLYNIGSIVSFFLFLDYFYKIISKIVMTLINRSDLSGLLTMIFYAICLILITIYFPYVFIWFKLSVLGRFMEKLFPKKSLKDHYGSYKRARDNAYNQTSDDVHYTGTGYADGFGRVSISEIKEYRSRRTAEVNRDTAGDEYLGKFIILKPLFYLLIYLTLWYFTPILFLIAVPKVVKYANYISQQNQQNVPGN